MKKALIFTVIATIINVASFAQSTSYSQRSSSLFDTPSTTTNSNIRYQDGYYKSNGTYVQPHMKTERNSTNRDNYSTQDNINPQTLQEGTKAKDYTPDAYNYGQGKQIQTGERGGQYYINSNGNKTYVPKRTISSSPW
jgi:Ni/Co efflux regulator RcnB